MIIGLLGIDDAVSTLVATACRDGDRIGVAIDLPDNSRIPFPPTSAPGAPPRHDTWETLLDPGTCDVIFVGAEGWSDVRADAVRRLVQAGRALVLSQPLDPSMLFAYEIEMIRRDCQGIVVPLLTDRLHPYAARLRDWIEWRLPAGGLESISFQRRLADRSRHNVLRWFSRDADLVRMLTGAPSRLSTLGGGDEATAWPTLAVGLAYPDGPPVRWQVVRSDKPGLTITAIATDSTVTVEIPTDTAAPTVDQTVAPWIWHGPDGAETMPFDRPSALLDAVRQSLSGGRGTSDPAPATWDDAARAIELAETIPRSLTKGRGIDLHQEEFTEIGTFKGTMASLGCGIVLLALLIAVVATMLGGIARQIGWEWGERLAGIWPLMVLAAMGLFLLLQLLPLLVANQPAARPKDRPSAPRDGDHGPGKERKP